MLRSLFSAVSGLRAHQTMMDVVGNNIANVNTAGYKSSQTVFEDTLSQLVTAAGSPQGGTGGTNPAQVGLGVKVAGVSTDFAQGATQLTGKPTDVAIQGDGFFVVRKGGQTFYSRAGAFSFDADGNLVNPDGAIVQGWQADAKGVISTNGAIGGLKLPIGQPLAPSATGTVDVGGNLPANATGPIATSITVYDNQGKAIPATATFTPSNPPDGSWKLDVTMPDATGNPVNVFTQSIAWNGTAFDTPSVAFTPPATVGSFAQPVKLGLGTATNPLTQYADTNSLAALDQDGSALGSLQSFTLDPDGTLIGVFSNGLKQPLGRVALANFNNPEGLEKAGGSLYSSSVNSGVANVGTSGTNGRGTLASGVLEMSNVDLAQEFSNLIIAQRGFQANSRVITASDEILQDLVNMKH